MTQNHMVDAGVVATALGISTSAVYQLGKRDELPFKSHKFGKIVRFRRIDVEEFLGGPLEGYGTIVIGPATDNLRVNRQVVE